MPTNRQLSHKPRPGGQSSRKPRPSAVSSVGSICDCQWSRPLPPRPARSASSASSLDTAQASLYPAVPTLEWLRCSASGRGGDSRHASPIKAWRRQQTRSGCTYFTSALFWQIAVEYLVYFKVKLKKYVELDANGWSMAIESMDRKNSEHYSGVPCADWLGRWVGIPWKCLKEPVFHSTEDWDVY